MNMKKHLALACAALTMLVLPSALTAASPYDLPYGIQWNFIIGNINADAPYYCGVSPDGTVWMTTGGTALSTPTMTWGSPNTVYSSASACGYGQISPLGGILQGNDIPNVPTTSGYRQGNSTTVTFAGDSSTAHVHLNVDNNATFKWADSIPADATSHMFTLMSFTVDSLANSPPVDYTNSNLIATMPIKNIAGLDATKKFTYDLVANSGYSGGGAHDSAVASDGTVYWATQNQGPRTGYTTVDMFTAGDFSGPLNASYKPAIGWIAANGSTIGGPTHQPSCGGRSLFTDIALNEDSHRVYACGYGWTSTGTMNFFDPDGPGPLASFPLNSGTPDTYKGFAMVYTTTTWDVLQTVIWESTSGGEQCTDIATTPDDGFVVVGHTKGSLGGFSNPAAGTTDGYMEKYNDDGTLAWKYQTQTTEADNFRGVTVDPADGTVYVSGTSGTDTSLRKFTAAGVLVSTTIIDNSGTSETMTMHGNRDKKKIYCLSLYAPYTLATGGTQIGTPWPNTISYTPVGNNENLLQKLVPGDFNADKIVNFTDVQMAGAATKPGLTGNNTYDFNGDGNSTLADTYYMITDIMDRLVGDIAQDPFMADVDNADIGKAIGSVAGSGKLYLDGDIDFDVDVDSTDIAAVAGAFTGAKAPGRFATQTLPAGATLGYRASDGLVWINASEAAGGIVTSFQLENAAGPFVPANYTSPTGGSFGGGLKDVTSKVIGDTDLTLAGASGIVSLGPVFPTGMDLTGLTAYLKTSVYTGQAGSGQKQFILEVGEPPATVVKGGSIFTIR